MSEILAFVLRWLARLSALLVAWAFLLLIAGETYHPHAWPPAGFPSLGVSLVAVAVVGMVLAWFWELPGASVSLACLAAFVGMVHMHNYGPIAVAAAPGILFVMDWLFRRLARLQATSK
ncbi:MAG: hypothetical protein LAP40_17935 [Acidobacteriia bacterium]|nr:hypothetical protein [Terriglobia bacterium]